jgi:glyoxylase-like metal-dependent hydrolase (beta-lactamase superfamily II)
MKRMQFDDRSVSVVVALALLVGAGAALLAQAPVPTAELVERGLGPDDFPQVTRLADNVYVYSDVHTQGEVTTNNLVVITSEGVLVADGQGRPEQTARLVAEIRELTEQPIRYVVVASNHGDHTGGNVEFPDTATFIAHPTSQAAMEAAASRPARGGGPSQVVVPTETVADRRVLDLGGTEIHILHLGRSHTGGDLAVYLPEERILHLSETFYNRMFPSIGGGYPSEWIAAIERAEAMDVDVYIPGHGFIDDPATLRAEVTMFRRALERVVAEGTRLHAAGVPVEDAPAQADLGEFADFSISEQMAPGAIARVYAELDGELD